MKSLLLPEICTIPGQACAGKTTILDIIINRCLLNDDNSKVVSITTSKCLKELNDDVIDGYIARKELVPSKYVHPALTNELAKDKYKGKKVLFDGLLRTNADAEWIQENDGKIFNFRGACIFFVPQGIALARWFPRRMLSERPEEENRGEIFIDKELAKEQARVFFARQSRTDNEVERFVELQKKNLTTSGQTEIDEFYNRLNLYSQIESAVKIIASKYRTKEIDTSGELMRNVHVAEKAIFEVSGWKELQPEIMF